MLELNQRPLVNETRGIINSQFFREFNQAELNNQIEKHYKKLLKVDLLIIDDFAIKKIDQTLAEFISQKIGPPNRKRLILIYSRCIISVINSTGGELS